MTAKSYLLFASFLFFSCARGINKNTKIVKIHSQLPYSIVSERGNNSSKAEYNLAKYDTATIKRSVNPLTLNVLIADSSQILEIKPKLSPLIYLNIPNAVIGTLALGTMLRFGFEPVSLKFLAFGAVGYGGLVIDSKSNRKYTYPHHIYIYEKDKKAYFLPFDRKILAQKNALKISPFRLIDSGSPSYELAYERKLNKSFSAQYLMATMNEKPTRIGINNTFEGKRYGYELRYFLKKTAPIGPYIALDHNRLSQKFDDIINFHKKKRHFEY